MARRAWMRIRWWELLPDVVLAAGLTFFLVDEPTAATSAFKSTRAVVLMAGVGIGWTVGRLVVARYVRWSLVRLAPFVAAAAFVLAVVVVPAYDEHKVVESLQADQFALAEPGKSISASPSASAEPMVVVSTSAPVTPLTSSSDPVQIRAGVFRGIDHRASGSVNIYRRADGSYVVGLEHFDIQPGPDYDVYVVAGANRRDRSGGTRLDDLRGNSGTQYYEVGRGPDLSSGPWTVLIWCQTFGVPVANATPT